MTFLTFLGKEKILERSSYAREMKRWYRNAEEIFRWLSDRPRVGKSNISKEKNADELILEDLEQINEGSMKMQKVYQQVTSNGRSIICVKWKKNKYLAMSK